MTKTQVSMEEAGSERERREQIWAELRDLLVFGPDLPVTTWWRTCPFSDCKGTWWAVTVSLREKKFSPKEKHVSSVGRVEVLCARIHCILWYTLTPMVDSHVQTNFGLHSNLIITRSLSLLSSVRLDADSSCTLSLSLFPLSRSLCSIYDLQFARVSQVKSMYAG